MSALPNLIVIGAAKTGTTSLHHYLHLHPDIFMAKEKELHFFSSERVWQRGAGWYAAQFDGNVAVRGESSVTYTAYPFRSGVVERMFGVIPEARLIYLVRDPIERLVSAWVHRTSKRREHRPLAEVIEELEGNDLVERSRYYYQLEQYLAYYPSQSILVLCAEELRTKRRETMAEVYRFLGVDPTFDSHRLDEIRHESHMKRRQGRFAAWLGRMAETPPARILSPRTRRRIGYLVYRPLSRPLERPVLDARDRERLAAYFASDVARLREHTGRPFDAWSL